MADQESILDSVKKVLSVSPDYTEFDWDIIMHINSVFGKLTQLGVGPEEGFFIESDDEVWDDFTDDVSFKMVRSYVFLNVKMLFDPPQTGFLLEAMQTQIAEWDWRIQHQREWNLDPTDPMDEVEEAI